MHTPLSLLQSTFKLPGFRPGQEAVINALVQGRSALAVFPTGGGKSLCYQLPALLFDGLTLIVSPLIALMKDQVDSLTALGIAAARLDSSLDQVEVQRIYQSIHDGSLKILYVSPERLKNERFVARLKTLRISLLAIDEAHCISEWGHNFRPDYLKLAGLARSLNVERVLALTATATPAVARDICQQFSIAPADHIQTSFRRPNLQLSVTPCDDSQRRAELLTRLTQQLMHGASIVYVTLQHTAEQVAEFLVAQGMAAAFYHAGMADDDRNHIQNRFMSGEIAIVVATIAFGMGIDKSNIRAVYHYNLPKSIENYVQEIGRAGRDGKLAHCELFACADDLRVLENFIYGDTPTRASLRALLDELLNGEVQFDISTYELSQRFDIRPLVLSTALTYLELEGIIVATAPFYTEYKVHFLRSPDEILASFDGERVTFLEQVFAAGKSGRKWLTLDLSTIEQKIQQPRTRVIKALEYIQEQGWIDLGVANLRQGYRRLNVANVHILLDKLVALFEQRERKDIERIHQVIDYVNNATCLTNQLLNYFGEASPTPCGFCSHCVKKNGVVMNRPESRPLTEQQRALIAALQQEAHAVLAQPRQLARFLCGLPSPATSRSRLRSHQAFGALASLSFIEILAVVDQ